MSRGSRGPYVASHRTTIGHRDEWRHFSATPINRERTPWVKRASARWIDGARHFSLQGDL